MDAFLPQEIGSFLVALTLLWFLVYWVFGGVVFSLISLLRPGKLKRVRFSCLYTILSAFVAYGAAKYGILWAAKATGTVPETASITEAIVVLGGMGFVGILLGMMAGLVVLFLGGWALMMISRSHTPSWYDRVGAKDEE